MLSKIMERHGLLNSKIIEIYFFDMVKLPRKYIRQLGWKTDDKLFACVNPQDNSIEISRKDDGVLELWKWRMVALPHDFCEHLEWGRRDKLKVEVIVAENKLRLSLHKKLKLKCQDCRTKDNVILMNNSCFLDQSEDYGICRSCQSKRSKRFIQLINELKQKYDIA